MNYFPENYEASYSYLFEGVKKFGVFYKEDAGGYKVIPMFEKSDDVDIDFDDGVWHAKQLKHCPHSEYIPQLYVDLSVEPIFIATGKVLKTRARIYVIHLDYFIAESKIFVFRPGVIDFYGIQYEKIGPNSYRLIGITDQSEISKKFPAHVYTGIAG